MESPTRQARTSRPQRAAKMRRPRLISIDDNVVCDQSEGFQFANQLLTAAAKLGFRPALATHVEFAPTTKPSVPIASVFNTNDMAAWSLRMDGNSKYRRDLDGKSIGGSSFQNIWQRTSESMFPADRRPANMLSQWASDLLGLMETVRIRKGDMLLINAADDFTLLALAAAFQQLEFPSPIRVDMVFHLPVQDDQSDPARAKQFAIQVNDCVRLMQPHQVFFHATSPTLAEQMRDLGLRLDIDSIPFPIQSAEVSESRNTLPLRILIAGTAKTIDQQQAIANCLGQIEGTFLKPGRCQVAMKTPVQLDDSDFASLLTRTARDNFHRGQQGDPTSAIELVTNLTTPDYQDWLSSADVAVFLHDPKQYAAKTSSVLLEMMIRGIPVIVPDKCWLADQVRAAGGHRSIGFIYQNREEVAGLLRQFLRLRSELVHRSVQHAKVITAKHAAKAVLTKMGMTDALRPSRVA